MGMLDKLFNNYRFPVQLYSKIRNNIVHNYLNDEQSESMFVESLPLNLKQNIANYIYEPMRTKFDWLKGKN